MVIDKNKSDAGDIIIDKIGDSIDVLVDEITGEDVLGDVAEAIFENVAGGIKELIEQDIDDKK